MAFPVQHSTSGGKPSAVMGSVCCCSCRWWRSQVLTQNSLQHQPHTCLLISPGWLPGHLGHLRDGGDRKETGGGGGEWGGFQSQIIILSPVEWNILDRPYRRGENFQLWKLQTQWWLMTLVTMMCCCFANPGRFISFFNGLVTDSSFQWSSVVWLRFNWFYFCLDQQHYCNDLGSCLLHLPVKKLLSQQKIKI